MAFNQWNSRGWNSVVMEREELSSHLNKSVSTFPESVMTIETRVVPHLVFLTCLMVLVCVLMSGEGGGLCARTLCLVSKCGPEKEFQLLIV